MREYRIVKETTTNTNITKYYIEEKKRFFWWTWWDRQTYYCHGIALDYDYPTYQTAKSEVDKLTDRIIREVVE